MAVRWYSGADVGGAMDVGIVHSVEVLGCLRRTSLVAENIVTWVLVYRTERPLSHNWGVPSNATFRCGKMWVRRAADGILPNLRYPEAMDVNLAPSGIVIVIGLWCGFITVSRCSNCTGKYIPEEPVSEIRLCKVRKGVTELNLFIELQDSSTNKQVSRA